MHAQEVVELILKQAGEDVLKQIELAAAVKDRLTDVNPNKDLPVALAIVESVKSWLKEIKNKFKGRFPNDIRSLYQGVHQAVSLADAKRSDVARLLGTSSRLLKEGRARFWAFIEGKIKDLVELRGEMRSDKFPEEWAEFIVETWCSDRCTRASERSLRHRTKCATRAPRKALALQVQAQLIGHGEIVVVMNGDPEHGAQEPIFIGEAAALYYTKAGEVGITYTWELGDQ